ncbi:MAG: hypothetical protein RLZZ450_7035 [Pseudomonadota bacterium]|jgi:hypothetical protein
MSVRWSAIALLWLVGCAGTDLTEVVVVVVAEPEIVAQTQGLSVKVYGESSSDAGVSELALDLSNAPWSSGAFTVALAPKMSGHAGRYRVEASALKEGQPIATARLISGYVLGETRYVRLLLEEQCVGVSCDAHNTCAAKLCIGAELDPSTFVQSRGDIVASDGSVVLADAASAGQACGATDLSTCTAQGKKYEVAKDYAHAVPLFIQACNGGTCLAASILGVLTRMAPAG